MRITELNINNEVASRVGLNNNTLKKLGSLVALIGKNGSGKTRVLNLLDIIVKEMSLKDIKNGHLQLLPKTAYESLGLSTEEIHNIQASKKGSRKQIGNEIWSESDYENVFKEIIKGKIVRIDPDSLMNIKTDDNKDLLKFEVVIDSNRDIESFDSAELTRSGILFINSLSSRLIIEEFHARRKNQNLDQVPNHKVFNRLKEIVYKMLGIILSVEDVTKEGSNTIEGIIYLNDQPFNYSLLSPGQKVLFSYCIYFFIIDLNPSFNLKDSIIVIDEPERHLHPEAQIQLVEGVHKIVENDGQLWIATHSVHILSYLKPEQIFYLENGSVQSPSSMTPSKALDALLGYSYNKDELTALLLSTTDWAFSKFIADCLINPEVIIKTTKNDPQFSQFYEYIKSRSFENILDYGAGHGRLEKTLEETNAAFSFKIDVFEPNKGFFKELSSIKIINNVIAKKEAIKEDFYDLVILSNVLHEIELENWKSTLESIMKSLKYKGQLMILEDLILPKGEAPTEIGYLVLGQNELKALFEISGEILSIEPKDEKYKGRIMCTIIPKDRIYHVSIYSIEKAIKLLKERCLTEIKTIIKSKDITLGKRLGFYNQQYINCEFALEFLSNNKYSMR